MTSSLLKRDLEASIMWENAMAQQRELENDPGVRAFRSINARRRPDLSNTSDNTDVCGWLERLETYAREFAEEYGESRSPLPFKVQDIEEIGELSKRLIIAIQDARERAGILD